MAVSPALLCAIAARAADTEQQRRLPADLAAEMAQAGLFRMLVPRAMGGGEVDVAAMFAVLEQLGRADAATGWCVMIGGTTALISAWLPEAHAREIWADPDVITGGVFAPMGRAAVDGDDYVVTGRWSWGSGSANCSWLLGGAVVTDGGEMQRLPGGGPDHRMMVMRRSEVELIDTWDALGMRGTGSGDLAASNVRVPRGRSVSFITDTPRETGALYRFAPFGLLALGIAAVASGNVSVRSAICTRWLLPKRRRAAAAALANAASCRPISPPPTPTWRPRAPLFMPKSPPRGMWWWPATRLTCRCTPACGLRQRALRRWRPG